MYIRKSSNCVILTNRTCISLDLRHPTYSGLPAAGTPTSHPYQKLLVIIARKRHREDTRELRTTDSAR